MFLQIVATELDKFFAVSVQPADVAARIPEDTLWLYQAALAELNQQAEDPESSNFQWREQVRQGIVARRTAPELGLHAQNSAHMPINEANNAAPELNPSPTVAILPAATSSLKKNANADVLIDEFEEIISDRSLPGIAVIPRMHSESEYMYTDIEEENDELLSGEYDSDPLDDIEGHLPSRGDDDEALDNDDISNALDKLEDKLALGRDGRDNPINDNDMSDVSEDHEEQAACDGDDDNDMSDASDDPEEQLAHGVDEDDEPLSKENMSDASDDDVEEQLVRQHDKDEPVDDNGLSDVSDNPEEQLAHGCDNEPLSDMSDLSDDPEEQRACGGDNDKIPVDGSDLSDLSDDPEEQLACESDDDDDDEPVNASDMSDASDDPKEQLAHGGDEDDEDDDKPLDDEDMSDASEDLGEQLGRGSDNDEPLDDDKMSGASGSDFDEPLAREHEHDRLLKYEDISDALDDPEEQLDHGSDDDDDMSDASGSDPEERLAHGGDDENDEPLSNEDMSDASEDPDEQLAHEGENDDDESLSDEDMSDASDASDNPDEQLARGSDNDGKLVNNNDVLDASDEPEEQLAYNHRHEEPLDDDDMTDASDDLNNQLAHKHIHDEVIGDEETLTALNSFEERLACDPEFIRGIAALREQAAGLRDLRERNLNVAGGSIRISEVIPMVKDLQAGLPKHKSMVHQILQECIEFLELYVEITVPASAAPDESHVVLLGYDELH
jgi:hypothetical protein